MLQLTPEAALELFLQFIQIAKGKLARERLVGDGQVDNVLRHQVVDRMGAAVNRAERLRSRRKLANDHSQVALGAFQLRLDVCSIHRGCQGQMVCVEQQPE